MSLVVNHLLFHKAMIGVNSEKIDQYIDIASGANTTAEVSTIEDPFTRSVTLLFMLVNIEGKGFFFFCRGLYTYGYIAVTSLLFHFYVTII